VRDARDPNVKSDSKNKLFVKYTALIPIKTINRPTHWALLQLKLLGKWVVFHACMPYFNSVFGKADKPLKNNNKAL